MVTLKVIKNLYKKYNHTPESTDFLDLATLFEQAAENHGLVVDEDKLYIGSVDPKSPFAAIPLSHINGIVEFDNVVAIILSSSIIFLEKHSDKVNIHLRLEGPSLLEKIKMSLHREGSRSSKHRHVAPVAIGA